jgi:pimeloyl-ACP methyl ester carboxylesterase
VPADFLETVVRESLKLPARVWKAVLREGLLEPDFSVDLAKIRAPTLVLWGDRDALTADDQATLVAMIEGSRLVTYAGAGHGLHWEEPERFAADLAAFVEKMGSVPF